MHKLIKHPARSVPKLYLYQVDRVFRCLAATLTRLVKIQYLIPNMHELNFIPLSYRKNVDLPKVIIEPKLDQLYGGYYDTTKKVIVAVESDHIASTLSHEYRHHLQVYYGHTLKVVGVEQTSYEEYPLFIRKYFRTSWSEMDALLFESKITPSPVNTYWLKGLVIPQVLPVSLYM